MEIPQLKRSARYALLISLLIAGVCGPVFGQSSSPRPGQRAAEDHFILLMSSAFDALERSAEEARKGARLSDGQAKLDAIYAATAGSSSIKLTDEGWKARRQRLEEWRARFPGSVTARVALARFPLAYAWFARGNGYANSVSPEAWALMRQRTEEALTALQALDAGAKEDPGWATAMLDVAFSQAWPRERFEALYETAAAKHPDYLAIYFSYANYYEPQWFGSPEEHRRAVDRVVERTRPRMGETMYARLNWASTMENIDMFKNGQADWSRMKAGFERMTKDYPDAWNMNNYARFACWAGDWATFDRVSASIGEKPVTAAWTDNGEYQRCRILRNPR
jgi:hypothetical protein